MIRFQKTIKYFAIALASIIILNIFYFGTFIIYSVVNVFDGGNKTEEINEVSIFSDEISSLKIKLDYANFEIVSGDKFQIDYNKETVNWKLNNKELVINDLKRNWFEKNTKSKIIMMIPNNFIFENVEINTGVGLIDIKNLNSNDLNLNVGIGKCYMENLNINNSALIDGGVGEVQITSGKINNLDLKVGVGLFSINSELTGKNSIEAGVGELNVTLIDGLDNYTIVAEKGIGSISVGGINIKENIPYGSGINYIEVEGGIGSINLN